MEHEPLAISFSSGQYTNWADATTLLMCSTTSAGSNAPQSDGQRTHLGQYIAFLGVARNETRYKKHTMECVSSRPLPAH